MAQISEFLDALAANDALYRKYTLDPRAAMSEYELDDYQQDLILTGDLRDIKAAIGDEVSALPYVIVRFVLLHAADAPEGEGGSGGEGGEQSGA
jgi:hypothetical protein